MIEASKENPQSYIMFIVFLTFWTTIAAPVTPVEIGGGCVFGPGTAFLCGCVYVYTCMHIIASYLVRPIRVFVCVCVHTYMVPDL